MNEPAVEPDIHDAASLRATAAIRRLGELVAGRHLDAEVLDRIATAADALADGLDAAPRRDKAVDMQRNGRWEHFRRTGTLPPPPPDGGHIEFDRTSIVGGPHNPFGLVARHTRDGDGALCRVTATAPFEGPAHRVHGGVLALIVDEAMATVLPLHGVIAFTGELRLRLVAPAPLEQELTFRSRMTERTGRRITITCEGTSEEGRFVEAEGTFIEIDPAKLPWFTS